MNLKVLEEKITKSVLAYGKRHHIEFTPEFAAVKLMEEVGEFAQALLIHQKKCRESKFVPNKVSKRKLGYELADIISIVLVNAKIHNIDISKALDEKCIHREIAKSWETKVLPKV